MSRAEELRAELAALGEPVITAFTPPKLPPKLISDDTESDSVSGEVVDGHGGIYLIIREEEFECRRVSTSWQMMQFAQAQRKANITIPSGLPESSPKRKELEERRNQAGMRMMALLLDTCMILLKPGERQRFEDFMDAASADDKGLELGELENAIGNVIAAAGGEKGKAEQHTASPSSASSGTTGESVRVISFNRDGAETSLPAKT